MICVVCNRLSEKLLRNVVDTPDCAIPSLFVFSFPRKPSPFLPGRTLFFCFSACVSNGLSPFYFSSRFRYSNEFWRELKSTRIFFVDAVFSAPWSWDPSNSGFQRTFVIFFLNFFAKIPSFREPASKKLTYSCQTSRKS